MKYLILFCLLLISGCTSAPPKTVEKIDVQKFMGDWYVLAGRFTDFETEVHNAKETYTWNAGEDRIDVAFVYNKGSFEGPIKSIPQKAWIENKTSMAHWKVSPLWPFKFDYLVIAVADDYSWTAIGVPSQKYLWIMARDWKNPEPTVKAAVERLQELPYDVENLVTVPHRWP
jgi:apolipoprotein D and lipocalin family protein